MIDRATRIASPDVDEATLRADLARADASAVTVAPILRHLLASDDHSLFADEIVARVRGMVTDIARQLVAALGGRRDADTLPDDGLPGRLSNMLLEREALLAHLHALALEWQLSERLQLHMALDPIVPPLLQALIASDDAPTADTAMKLLAAQARFGQAQRRMACQLTELPGDLLHAVLLTFRTCMGTVPEDDALAGAAEKRLRMEYDEGRNRLGLAARLVSGMGGGAVAALSIGHAGVAVFLSALAATSGQDRDLAVLATHETQQVRLAISLRAAGMTPADAAEQFLTIHPLASPIDLARVSAERAIVLLEQAGGYPGK